MADLKIKKGFYEEYAATKVAKREEAALKKSKKIPESQPIVVRKDTVLGTVLRYAVSTVRYIGIVIIFILAVIGGGTLWGMIVNPEFRELAIEIFNLKALL